MKWLSGCAELGDNDPTSVAAAITYAGELENVRRLLPEHFAATFDPYMADRRTWMKPGASFHYTPYEARNAPVFLYSGRKDDALALIRFFLSCSRPYRWFQLAEVVNSDPRNPYYLGDIPHTWVGAEMMNAIRGLFVYEKDGAVVVGAGIDPAWLDRPEGITVRNLPTYFGRLGYAMKKEGDAVTVEFSGDVAPERGILLQSPLAGREIRSVEVDGAPWTSFTPREVTLAARPGRVTIRY